MKFEQGPQMEDTSYRDSMTDDLALEKEIRSLEEDIAKSQNQEEKEKDLKLLRALKENRHPIRQKIRKYQNGNFEDDELRQEILNDIKAKTRYLSAEEFTEFCKKEWDESGRQEVVPMEIYPGVYSPELLAPVINKDILDSRFHPYVQIHESVELLGEGKWVDKLLEIFKKAEIDLPREDITPHLEAIFEEYLQAQEDGVLEEYHKEIMTLFERHLKESPDKEKTEKMIRKDQDRREIIFRFLLSRETRGKDQNKL